MTKEWTARTGEVKRRTLPDKLREWLEVFSQMIAIVPGPVYFKDVSGRYRVFNQAFERFMGISGDEIAGRTSRELLPAAIADLLEEMDCRLLCGCSLHQSFQTSYTDQFDRERSVLVNRSILNLHGLHQGIVGVITDVTELERTKGELARSQKLLRNVFEAIPDLLSVQDRELRVLQSNWHGGYGYVPEELRTGQPHCFEAYYPGQSRPCSPCHVLEVFRTGRPVLTEKLNPRIGHVEVNAFPIRDEAGAVVMVAEHVRNISDRKRAEQELCEANERLKAVIDASPLPICAMDKNGIVQLWNSAAERVFGWEAGEILGRAYPLLTGQREREFRTLFRRLNKGEIMFGDTVLRARKDGSTLSVSRYSAPLRDASGNITGTMAVLEDITERKRAEDEIKASEANYRAIFNAVNDAIFVLDPDNGAIIDVNSKMCEMYSVSREQARSMDIEAFSSGCHPYTQESAVAYIRKAGLGRSQLFEWMARSLDGRIFWVEVSIKKTMLGGMPRALAAVRDISGRKRAEEEAKKMQAKLLQTNKMVALGTLSSGIAHEINNPANFILSNAQMLSDAWKDIDTILAEYAREAGEPCIGGFDYGEARVILPKLLSGIVEGSHRIRNILAGLKEFAREEKAPLDQEVDLNMVMEKAFTIIRNQIKKHTNHFHSNMDPGNPLVRGSFQQLEQVVINLAMNALQALPDRECGVYASTCWDRRARNAVIKIRDQGSGMPPEVQKQIFDPFFTTRLDSGGTGLGLSICYSIIKEHGGSIEVESEPGIGTTIYVRIPLYAPQGECP